jgi:hypothetical protein
LLLALCLVEKYKAIVVYILNLTTAQQAGCQHA